MGRSHCWRRAQRNRKLRRSRHPRPTPRTWGPNTRIPHILYGAHHADAQIPRALKFACPSESTDLEIRQPCSTLINASSPARRITVHSGPLPNGPLPGSPRTTSTHARSTTTAAPRAANSRSAAATVAERRSHRIERERVREHGELDLSRPSIPGSRGALIYLDRLTAPNTPIPPRSRTVPLPQGAQRLHCAEQPGPADLLAGLDLVEPGVVHLTRVALRPAARPATLRGRRPSQARAASRPSY